MKKDWRNTKWRDFSKEQMLEAFDDLEQPDELKLYCISYPRGFRHQVYMKTRVFPAYKGGTTFYQPACQPRRKNLCILTIGLIRAYPEAVRSSSAYTELMEAPDNFAIWYPPYRSAWITCAYCCRGTAARSGTFADRA